MKDDDPPVHVTYQDPKAKVVPHDPIMDVEVVTKDKEGRPSLVRHVCRICGRLISSGRHV